ncbi:MAG: hypothetical protein J6Y78_10150 [Paludibacteraceae bacterium]|nr:hypothetical protein [Paludibacteraceae bacterium]
MNPIVYFIAFFIFLLCQVAMVFCGMFIADWTGATGHYYWSIVIVVFLLLNELCFHHYDFELNFNEDEDDDEYEWLGDENN